MQRPTFADSYPHLQGFTQFIEELNKESERGVVLVAAAMLESMLQGILAAYFVRGKASDSLLSGFSAPLGTLSARIKACRSLGLMTDEESDEAERVRSIRNLFAHEMRITFSDQRIASMCAALTFSVKETDAHNQFSTAAASLILNLTNRAHYVGLQRRVSAQWPY